MNCNKSASFIEGNGNKNVNIMKYAVCFRIFCVKAFVMVMTLTCAKVMERAHMLSQWIQIAMEVQSTLGNLFAFDSIMAGLMSDQVRTNIQVHN